MSHVAFMTQITANQFSFLFIAEDAVFAEPGGGSMMAGAVYTLPAPRNVPLPMAMQRLIPMATQGGKPRSFTLPRDSNLHTLLTPPAKEEQQTHNGEFMLDQAFGVKCLQGHRELKANPEALFLFTMF